MLSLLKGWLGETAATWGIFLSLDRKVYRCVSNLILFAGNGTTQIDHVIVSRHGIFVIETKNMKGWIFGNAADARWTQVLFGRKFRFQNPLRQNHRHACAIAGKLGVPAEDVHSIVFFIGDGTFKTRIPAGVFCRGVASHIRSHVPLRFSGEQVVEFERKLRDVKRHSRFTRAAHLRSLRERYESTSVCPKCGAALVEKVAGKGKRAGGRFLGCSSFPRCRFTRAT